MAGSAAALPGRSLAAHRARTLARVRRGVVFYFMLVLSTLMVPWEVTIVPSFLLFKWLGWLDTLAPLIVPHWFGGGPFFIFLLRQFFLTIPRDFDEAARIDGASSIRVLWEILIPLR